jgi:hypothetical protein
MEKAFPWLVGFIISQLALMAIAAMPLERWRSFQANGQRASPLLKSADVTLVPTK